MTEYNTPEAESLLVEMAVNAYSVLRNRYQELEDDLQVLKETENREVTALKKKIDELLAELKRMDEGFTALNKQHTGVLDQLAKARKEGKECRDDFIAATDLYGDTTKALNAANDRIEELTADLKEANGIIAELEGRGEVDPNSEETKTLLETMGLSSGFVQKVDHNDDTVIHPLIPETFGVSGQGMSDTERRERYLDKNINEIVAKVSLGTHVIEPPYERIERSKQWDNTLNFPYSVKWWEPDGTMSLIPGITRYPTKEEIDAIRVIWGKAELVDVDAPICGWDDGAALSPCMKAAPNDASYCEEHEPKADVTDEPPPTPAPSALRLPQDWSARKGITIIDPDGWRYPDAKEMDIWISEREFDERAAKCTIDRTQYRWDRQAGYVVKKASGNDD